jgi:mono/diheme cytochrome c family protein
MDPNTWAKLHGASTHFPIALVLTSVLMEGLALISAAGSPHKRKLRAAAHYTLVIGALGAFPAVWSGLLMTKWDALGHGALRWHHLFVWPAFALLLVLAVWRTLLGEDIPSRTLPWYLGSLGLAAGLMAGAGYWGGEMLMGQESSSVNQVALGRTYFLQSCAHCHGEDAHGDEGPDLHGLAIGDGQIARTIKFGIKGEMPAFSKKYGDPEVSALRAYLRSLTP